MSNSKKWMTAAGFLVAVGLIICIILFWMFGFSFGKLDTVKYVSNTYNVEDSFDNIKIKADIEKINFVLSEDKNCKVICYEEENEPHIVRVDNDVLVVERKNSKKKQLHIGISSESPEITLYLPENEYKALGINADTSDVNIPKDFSFEKMDVSLDTGDISCLASVNENINIKTDTGDISISEISASDMNLVSDTGKMNISGIELKGNIDIRECTGKVTMKDISCKKFTSDGDTGNLIMTNVIASDEFKLERDTGDIEFNDCDAETIYAKTSTGHVKGTLLTEKLFVTRTDTGNVDVPETSKGGKCEITTDTGNIKINLK